MQPWTQKLGTESPSGVLSITLFLGWLTHASVTHARGRGTLLSTGLDQMTVNEYPAGVGLAPHVDTHSAFAGPILSLSLAGHTVMEFRHGTDKRALYLPRRSLLVMSRDARYR